MRLVAALLLFSLLSVLLAAQGPATDGDLFVAVGAAPGGAVAAPDVMRERLVQVDRDLLMAARVNAGRPSTGAGLFRLNLFEDVVLGALIDDTGPTSAGYWLAGRISGSSPGEWTLVVNGDVIVGTVRTMGVLYKISAVDEGIAAIRQPDPSNLFAGSAVPGRRAPRPLPHPADPAPRPPRPAVSGIMTGVPGGVEDGARIDVLAIYTPTATALYGGEAQIRAELDLAIVEANQAYASSGVVQRLNLAFATEVDYVPDDNGFVNLRRLQDPNDGYLDEVHPLRDRYAADIVTLEPGGTHIQGGAFSRMVDPSTDFAQFAFSSHGISGFAFAHEFGHLQGLAHDRYQAAKETGVDLREHKPTPYSFGYVNQAALEPGAPRGKKWYTIMAYLTQLRDAGVGAAGGRARMRFSNPDQTYGGDPLGVPGDEPSSSVRGPADARRSLNETRAFVANFRVAPCLMEGDRVHLQANNGQFFSAVNNGGSALRVDQDVPGQSETFTLVDRNGGCLETGDQVSFHTSDEFYLRYVLSPLPYTVAADWWIASNISNFTIHRRYGEGAIRNGDFVTFTGTWAFGHYMRAENGGGGRVLLNSDVDGPWETFRIIKEAASFNNDPPMAVGALPDLTLHANGATKVSVSGAFRDPDGDRLTYGATSSSPGVASVSVSGSVVTVTPVAAGTATVTVTARDPAGASATQSIAVTVQAAGGFNGFTDDPIVPGVTPVRAVHFTELRTRIDSLRNEAGLAPFRWTDPELRAGVTPVRLAHLLELREALAAAYAAAGRAAPRWTDAAPAAGTTPIRAAHLTELRAAVVALE